MTATTKAFDLGYGAGKSTGSWVIDGNTSSRAAHRILQGIEDGDPEIMDMRPNPLSGEWADGPTTRDVVEDCDVSYDPEGDYTELLDSYEEGFDQGFWDQVQHAAKVVAS